MRRIAVAASVLSVVVILLLQGYWASNRRHPESPPRRAGSLATHDEASAIPVDDDRPVAAGTPMRLEGRVVNETGAPVAGARVICRHWAQAWDAVAPAQQTDTKGRFVIENLDSAQRHEVWATKDGYAEGHVQSSPGDHNLVIRLRPPARVSGTVMLPDGTPARVGNAWIRGSWQCRGRIRENGTFSLERVPPGWHTLVVESFFAVGYHSIQETVECKGTRLMRISGGEHAKVTIRMPSARFSKLPLRVTYRSGAPVRGATIDIADSWVLSDGPLITDDTGGIVAILGEYPDTSIPVTVHAQDTSLGVDRYLRASSVPIDADEAIDVMLPAIRKVRFRIRGPDGASLPSGIRISLHVYSHTRSRPDGSAIFSWAGSSESAECLALLPVADETEKLWYEVLADSHVDYVRHHWTPDPDGETIEVGLRPGATVQGSLLEPDGSPCNRAWVSGRAVRGGRFRFDDIPQGEFLVAVRTERGWLRRSVVVAEGEAIDMGTLRLIPRGQIAGIVKDRAGRPLGGAVVRTVAWTGTTRADGTFRCSAASDAEQWIEVRKWGYATAICRARSGNPVAVTLEPEGAVRVRSGRREFASLHFLVADRIEIRSEPRFLPEFGEWAFVGLPLGELTVELRDHAGLAVGTGTVTSVPSTTVCVRLP